MRVSNGSYPDEDRHTVGPGLDLSCLQRLSASDKSSRKQGKISDLFHLKRSKTVRHMCTNW